MTSLQLDGCGVARPTRALGRLGSGTIVDAPWQHDRTRLGPLTLTTEAHVRSAGASWTLTVQNTSADDVRVDSVGVGFHWSGVATGSLRFYQQGFQSWSFAGSAPLDDAGTPPFPSSAWLRGFHHVLDEVPADRVGWHESDGVTAAGGSLNGPTIVAGVLETGVTFGVVYLRRDSTGVTIEVEQRLERTLSPGERFELERIFVELGTDASALLERFAAAQGKAGGARTSAPFQAGWCSWYHFFLGVDESVFLRNLDSLSRARDEIPIDVVQLDGGYQRAYGDWLETNEKFPSGLEYLARSVRAAGFTPGIWTAPFCVVPESRVFLNHPGWLLRRDQHLFRCLHDKSWTPEGWIYALDPTLPEVIDHLEHIYRTTVAWGFTYQKLDFLYAIAMRADAHDPLLTRAQRMRRGLEAIRSGAGADAFLLGCGCPLGPAVGVVDGMRIGPDTAPWWGTLGELSIPGVEPTLPGLEPTVPAASNALRNTLTRSWMHRRLWLNDPDCLMAREQHTRLTPPETLTLARSIAISGGMTMLSDDVDVLAAAHRTLVRETLALARENDSAAIRGSVLTVPLLDAATPSWSSRAGDGDDLTFVLNPSAQPVTAEPPHHGDGAGAATRVGLVSATAPPVRAALAPHESVLYRTSRVGSLREGDEP